MDTKFWDIKETENIEELKYIHPYALLILADIIRFCYDSKIPAPVVTSLLRTKEEEVAAGAESTSHLTRRAFDLRSRDYTKSQVEAICNYVNTHWLKYAAKNSQGQIRGAIHHRVDGGGLHFHVQVSAAFALPEWKGLP